MSMTMTPFMGVVDNIDLAVLVSMIDECRHSEGLYIFWFSKVVKDYI